VKKLLIAVLVGLPLVGCTTETIYRQVPATETPAEPAPADPAADPATSGEPGDKDPVKPAPGTVTTADKCLDGQDMDAADVDIAACPAIPAIPESMTVKGKKTDLGAWELGTTSDGATYKYGTLSAPTSNPRTLSFEGGSVAVNAENLECWSKGYHRLRKMLQDPPAEWIALRDAGFQYRFFQFQTDLRNGPTGFKTISSFQDHLIKWVTVISTKGVCEQPTLAKFKSYAKSELTKRGIALPPN
jgi:hypothetical protein